MIIISGASRGLGKELFKNYFSKDEPVHGLFNSTAPNEFPLEHFSKVDVCDYNAIASWAEAIKTKQPQEIVLINCAGINYNSLLHKSEPAEWAKVINTNLVGPYNLIRALLPIMRECKRARIINIASVVPQVGMAGTTAYAASKAGLWGLSKSLSKEFKGKDITINTINLGYFETGMIEQVPAPIQETIKEKIPAARFGKVEEFIGLIDYIRNANYTNGSTFDMNGGFF